ncbi:MAG: Rrf2 family transcriptional regulator [Terrimicrobiaceae bacterium]|nr:Rrf2 family transcriptional regulator [Terrimicrobiaceae bacterium]
MKITRHSDYAFRLLTYLQLRPRETVRVREIAEAFGISENHLTKVSCKLARLGLVRAKRGRGGGVDMAPSAARWKLGDLMRALEPEDEMAACESPKGRSLCRISPSCRLRAILNGAREEFHRSLNRHHVGDLVGERARRLKKNLGIPD